MVIIPTNGVYVGNNGRKSHGQPGLTVRGRGMVTGGLHAFAKTD